MKSTEPTVRRQQVGEQLRLLRNKTQLSLDEAARIIHASPSKLSRVESGHRKAPIEDIAGLLALYRAGHAQRAHLLAMAHETDQTGWLITDRPGCAQRRHTLITLESKAEHIVYVDPVVIPEVLRTSDYTTAVMAESELVSNSDNDGRTEQCCRQSVLAQRQPPQRLAILDDSVLQRPLGGKEVLCRQLEHLKAAAADSRWTIRVMPRDHAITTGAFTLLRFPDRSPVVVLEYLTCSLFLEQPHDIDVYELALKRLDNNALDDAKSLDRISEVARHVGRN